ncbi:outer membrane lipoprotein carrier protein LolA, partial [Haloferula sp. A504]|uniref:outer membrane lipoprotein carrier protein LolA n=1 Tax=Haloferula sp. A504 TaxID=3373601 RepID=UPI0031C64F29|nr:outer membrane lipoprotein carrier protein LolA [Verrucomicrobiaceae bacterium E54]
MRLLLVLLLSLPLHAETDTAPLEAWLKRQSEIHTLQADFIQQRTLPALKKPVETPGKLWMGENGKLRWELGTPPKTIAVSNGAEVTFVDVAKQRAKVMDAESSEARSFTMLSGESMQGGLDGFLEV